MGFSRNITHVIFLAGKACALALMGGREQKEAYTRILPYLTCVLPLLSGYILTAAL